MSTSKFNIFPDFATALEEALIREGKSPAWLSRVTGKDKGQISKYINGNIEPRGITRRELTAPLSVRIFKTEEGKWTIESQEPETANKVQDSNFQYRADNYEEEKRKLENIFEKIQDVEKLYNEFEHNLNLTEQQKRIQIEMIREKIFAIFKTEFDL